MTCAKYLKCKIFLLGSVILSRQEEMKNVTSWLLFLSFFPPSFPLTLFIFNSNILIPLYKSLAGPPLEQCLGSWLPMLKVNLNWNNFRTDY